MLRNSRLVAAFLRSMQLILKMDAGRTLQRSDDSSALAAWLRNSEKAALTDSAKSLASFITDEMPPCLQKARCE